MFNLKYFFYTLIIFAVFISATTQAQTNPHEADNYNFCTICHAFTGSGIYTPRGAEQEEMCKTCHNPSGIAAGMSNVANHVVNGETIVECSACHDPHSPNLSTDTHTGTEAPNLSLIRSVARQFNNTDLIFQKDPEHFAFGEDNEPYNGICQACHTQTRYHTFELT